LPKVCRIQRLLNDDFEWSGNLTASSVVHCVVLRCCRVDVDSAKSPFVFQDALSTPAASEQSRLREKARLVRWWYNLDRRSGFSCACQLALYECQLVYDICCRLLLYNMLICIVPWTKTHLSDRSFSVAGPRVWHMLPASLQLVDDSVCLMCSLKVHEQIIYKLGCYDVRMSAWKSTAVPSGLLHTSV